MATQTPFNPNEFAKWLADGLKETLAYRLRQTFNREKLLEMIQAKVPTRNLLLHQVLRKSFEKGGFQFETVKHGDASFHLIRKKYRAVPARQARRLLLIPGLGDSPSSWIPPYAFLSSTFSAQFDEIMVLDFPGYLGFLSDHPFVTSMAALQSVVNTVCEMHPPTVLMGHSLGGWLAAKAAQELKTPLEHLMLISPSGLTLDDTERKVFGDFIVNSRNLDMEELLSTIMHEPKPFHQLLGQDMRAFFEQPAIKQFIESVKPEQFVNPLLPFQAKKLTVIWGENDRFVPAHWIRHWTEIYGEYLDAYLIRKTGHVPQLERPKVLADTILHALLDRKGRKTNHWTKVNSRKREFPVGPRIENQSATANLIG